MKILFKDFWYKLPIILTFLVFAIYLLLPSPPFPQPMPGSLKSSEPADMEDPLRQGYYTDWDRAQIMDYFFKEFSKQSFLGLSLPIRQLNYPPEEAQTIIRDQTKSRYLEEFVHPFRDSLFVSGFFAQKDTEVMIVDAHEYKTKVTVKMVPSNGLIRTSIGLTSLFLVYVAINRLLAQVKEARRG
ncbi:MAG: hypothetical protein UW69_C0042G0004 [Microgenomates group bacterium GW2011_GWA2_44_7]|nr:MAG: hypothetical protein UW69_C0042G0004 [Microgenomates group bacterium GW2011_GWA2_44_7]KKT78366.1 MAG: hypothetical protein UW73_C0003G0014 [Microgenomates group bacterium GW2011_GWB1_44_8]